MLTQGQNERLTQVGPGTPMGELMRRYWHPVAALSELSDDQPTKPVRLLGEDLVLYRLRGGRLGLITNRCAHRGMDLSYGIPEEDGLRCAYHGWMYDVSGQCIEQPSEPSRSNYKNEIKLTAYPVEELGGLVWAYLGPTPAPLVPRWDMFAWDNVTREISAVMLPCNWLQTVDNALDPAHFEHLHGYYGSWVMSQRGKSEEWDVVRSRPRAGHHYRIGFDRFEHGIIKRRVTDAGDENSDIWKIGHPIIFPYTLRIGGGEQHTFLLRVPVDDENTWYVRYIVRVPEQGQQAPPQDAIPLGEIPLYDPRGRLKNDTIPSQDQLAWVGQGAISDRTTEHLGVTDTGVIMYRRMLEEQMAIVAEGGDPINTFRDAAANECILLPIEGGRYPGYDVEGGPFAGQESHRAEAEANLV